MVSGKKWKFVYVNEMNHAVQARSSGNEGMARVCARRAAGIVVNEYFRRAGYTQPGLSSYQSLKNLIDFPEASPHAKEIANHFLIVVDKNHCLPEDIDLLVDAERLVNELIGLE